MQQDRRRAGNLSADGEPLCAQRLLFADMRRRDLHVFGVRRSQ